MEYSTITLIFIDNFEKPNFNLKNFVCFGAIVQLAKMGSIEIESRYVGRIIGPKGATIRQLQSDYNVKISISKEDNDVRFNRTFPNIHENFTKFFSYSEEIV